MSTQQLEDEISLLKGTVAYMTNRIGLQEQIAQQLREAQQSELAALQGFAKELAKLKSQIAMLSVRQTAMEEQRKQEGSSGDDGELPLLLKNSGSKSSKRPL